MKTTFERVTIFHQAFNIFIGKKPELPSQDVRDLRVKLIREEFEEYLQAEKENDLTGIADALADMIYVIQGTAVSYGIPMDRIIDEVHSSNMSKLGEDGKPILRDDGKVIKGPNYFKPNIKSILSKEN